MISPAPSQLLPRPFDPAMADRNRQSWHDACAAAGDDRLPPALQTALTGDARWMMLLDGIFGNSPFLSSALVRAPEIPALLLQSGPDAVLDHLLASIDDHSDTAVLGKQLRQIKRKVALLCALADMGGFWPLMSVTGALSRLACAALEAGCRHLLRKGHLSGEIRLSTPDDPTCGSGLVVLGMGKLGANELNYSSDIDIIVFYDPEAVSYHGRRSLGEFYVRLVRDLVKLVDERTADGYVFRMDLRLRPDPGSTPPAINLHAAEQYYESYGQNWERAAMIKARPVAGDLVAGEAFLKSLRPFIWRKHLDFAAMRDIHAIKRQINAHRGGGKIAVAGHNLKLGRGGIREIEFFAQTQQLIWGGRNTALRDRQTLVTLENLTQAGLISDNTRDSLSAAYCALRQLEHRLQMIDDQQTQTLPTDPQKLEQFAAFAAYPDYASFDQDLRRLLGVVETQYAALFEDQPDCRPAGVSGPLRFVDPEPDPDTLATLTGLGFTRPDSVIGQIRGWHLGRVRATRSERARDILTSLTPRLLQSLAATADPDAAFLRFDAFLSALPAGVSLFSLFLSNPSLLDLVAEIMGDAPRLADSLSRNPTLLDRVLSPDFYDPPPPVEQLVADLTRLLQDSRGELQDALDITRRWASEQRFRVGVQTLHCLQEPEISATHLTDIADAALQVLQPAVEADFARQHGIIPGGGAAVVALGKMGSREMTATSDLDLILIYDVPADCDASTGPKPLAPAVYYSRLTQRLINAITAKTGEGILYEVDMRLRPSGNSGPIATALSAFIKYQAESAWTWEHQALTRARLVTGPPALRAAITAAIRTTLTRRRDADSLRREVGSMRERMAAEHKAPSRWEPKHLRGGLVDIEFITQYLQLRWAAELPELLADPGTGATLQAAIRLGLLPAADGEALLEGWRLWTALSQVLRQTIAGAFREDEAPGRLKEILVRATASTHFEGLCLRLDAAAASITAVWQRIFADPTPDTDTETAAAVAPPPPV